jgi:NADPH2 dehydrogenase
VKFPHLFRPLAAGPFSFRNRVVIPPLVLRHASEDGGVTSRVLEHYKRMEGAGLVVVEATVVSPEGRLARNQIGIFDDTHIKGLTALAEVIHSTGALAALQIHHAGRNTTTENTMGLPMVAPSPFLSKRASAQGLSEPEIVRIMDAFVLAARRAATAGFDAVEVHAAHGYLISQFLSPLANQRTDRWGGSLENRARFLRDLLARIRAEGGPAAYCRLGVADGEAGGLTLREGLTVAGWLQEDGMPIIHVSHGLGGAPAVSAGKAPDRNESASFWASNILLLGIEAKKALSIPVIGVGGILRPELAEEVLSENLVDMVAVGRGILVDPNWIVKAHEGMAETIRECRDCKACHRFLHPERCPAEKQEATA